uniref:Uncharacterized protein n=1 Tax=viral metagenome TaxID=1070528 RepID=A0A6M3Y3H3_9ZZZZ
MAHGTPDWVRMVQVAVTVETKPIVPEPATESPIIKLKRLSTALTTYQEVVSWTVTAGKVGILGFIEMESDAYIKTMFQLTIGGTVYFTNMQIAASLSLEFPELHLQAGIEVLLEAKSTDGTSINVDGDIIAKEVS